MLKEKGSMVKNILNRILHAAAFILPGGSSVRPWLHKIRGVTIGKNIFISRMVYIDELHPETVFMGDNVTIGLRTTIFSHMYWGPRNKNGAGKVIIGNNVYIGPHCLILPNVKIGDGAVIKGGTVVTRNVPPNTLWGIPDAGPIARVTIPLTNQYSYEKFINGLKPYRNLKKNKNLINDKMTSN